MKLQEVGATRRLGHSVGHKRDTRHPIESPARKPIYRLDSTYPALATALRSAPPARKRAAARVAAEMAVVRSGVDDRDVAAALESLRAGATIDIGLRARIEDLAGELDESYLAAAEKGDGAGSLRLFSMARATSALAYALSEEHATLHEALYEATVAFEDPSDLVAAVGKVLG